MEKFKRVLAIAGLFVIIGWVLVTFVMAFINFPGRDVIFRFFLAGCVVFPIFIWIIIWFVGLVTNKKTIASFRTQEMENTMEEADSIKDKLKENGNLKNAEKAPEDK